MSDLGFRVFPSGFAVHDDVFSQTQLVAGDQEITDLYRRYRHGDGRADDFGYFMEVVKAAKRLLGADPNWLLAQIYNGNLNRYHVDFVTDTVIYLTTGRRAQTLTTWRALCEATDLSAVKSISLKGHPINRQIVLPKDLLFSQPAGIISVWLSKNGGFADLIESLYLMFGEKA